MADTARPAAPGSPESYGEKGFNESNAEIAVVNIAKEIEELVESGLLSIEREKWVREVGRVFGLRPRDIFDWAGKPLRERLEVLRRACVPLGLLREEYVARQELELEPEKLAKLRPSPSFVAEYIALKAVELELVEPVRVIVEKDVEYGVKVGRVAFSDTTLKSFADVLSGCARPQYEAYRLYTPVLRAFYSVARTYTIEDINPSHIINCENIAIDVVSLTPASTDNYLFTYALPPINPEYLKWLKEGQVDESYFAGRPFYQILRKHYSDEEWKKLVGALGAIVIPYSVKLLAIVKGPPNTRKTLMAMLMKKALRSLAAVINLKEISSKHRYTFALEGIEEARVVIASEAAQTIVHSVDEINQITGGDPLRLNRKFRKALTREDNPIKMFIFTNELPQFTEVEDATVDRLLVIDTENPARPSGEERELIDKALKKPGEFLEFLLWCSWVLRTEYKGQIPGHGDPKYKETLIRGRSNVFEFAAQLAEGEIDLKVAVAQVVFGPSCKIKGSELYDAYVEWCTLKGLKVEGRNTFYQLIETALREKGVYKAYEDGGAVIFRGIKLIPKGLGRVEEELSRFTEYS